MPLHLRKAFWICIGFPNYFFEHFRFVFYSNTVKYWILSALIFRTKGFFARKNNNTKKFHWKSIQIKYKKSKHISIENQCKWHFPDFHPLVKKKHRFSTIKKNHCYVLISNKILFDVFFAMSMRNFPRIPKITLRKSYDHYKNTKSKK